MIGFQIIATMTDVKLPRGGAQIIAREVYEFLQTLAPQLSQGVKDRMRVGVSGAVGVLSEKESVVTVVTPGMNPMIRTSSNLIKAAVDETGRRPGAGVPPFGPGSLLREWVIGTLNPEPASVPYITKRIARNINERGLPRPGDPLRAPFKTTFRATLPMVVEGLREAGARAVQKINHGTQ